MRLSQFTKDASPRRFLLLVAGLSVAGLVATCVINALVDPYDLWQLVELPGLPNRPMQRGHDRMHKAALIRHRNPNGIVLGTSRSQVMISSASRAFAGHATRIVNAALDGSIAYESRRMLEHAFAQAGLSKSKIALIVYGLDLYSFDASHPPNEGYSEQRLLVSDAGRQQSYAQFADVVPSLLSWDALLATAATLMRRDWPSYLLADGQRDPRFQERGLLAAGGQRALFQASERDYGQNYACFEESDANARPYRDVRRLLDEAALHASKVRLYISPAHARHGVVLRIADLADVELRWKRLLVREVERARAAGCDVELWDFSGVAFDEQVPASGDRHSRMRWWWESSHATSALGERLLPRMLDAPNAEALGQRLTSSNLEPWLLDLQQRQASWQANHPSDVSEVTLQTSTSLAATRRRLCPQRASRPGTIH